MKIWEFPHVKIQFSQRKNDIFHPDFFLCNSMDQYSRFRTSRTPRTVAYPSGTIFSSKTTSFCDLFGEEFIWGWFFEILHEGGVDETRCAPFCVCASGRCTGGTGSKSIIISLQEKKSGVKKMIFRQEILILVTIGMGWCECIFENPHNVTGWYYFLIGRISPFFIRNERIGSVAFFSGSGHPNRFGGRGVTASQSWHDFGNFRKSRAR